MTEIEIIKDISLLIRDKFKDDSSGHDWFHIERVWKTSKSIALIENANVFTTELGALLHDIADHKFVKDHESESIRLTRKILSKYELSDQIINDVIHIVLNCSYKGGFEANKMKSLEGKIVQDADKLDAIGAIGIARTFAFGGKFGSILYNPEIPAIKHDSLESYHNNRPHTINHFYEKLLKLKDLMHTNTSKKMAETRHLFMETYLEQFYKEWHAKID